MPSVIRLLLGFLLLCAATTLHAQMTVTPASLRFGPQQIYSESEPQSVLLTNTGNASLTVIAISTTGQTPYRVSGGSCGPRPFTIAAQSSCTLDIRFGPGPGSPNSNGFDVVGSGGVVFASIFLHGTGVSGELDTFLLGRLDFPATAVGTTSASQTVRVRSSGSGPVDILSITPATAPFSRVGGTCGTPPFSLVPFMECTLVYTFSPTAAGAGQTQAIVFGLPVAMGGGNS